ncbi:subtilisin-like protein [Lactarius hengduanensis]|nr:subtilisin-like protein [Lactarius hengduanensis]
MRCHALAVLSILSVAPFSDLATPPLPPWGGLCVKHTWNTVPPNWETLGPPPPGTTIDLYIALQPRRDSVLIDALHELVHSWLEHHRVPSSSISTSHGGGWLTITGMPVSQADELLSASYQLYRHTGENATEVILRTVSYSLPAVLHAHVQTVAPTTLPQASRQYPSEVGASSSCECDVEGAREFTDSPGTWSRRSDVRWLRVTMRLGSWAFNDEYPSYTDLTQFMTEFRADAVLDATFTVQQVNGGGFNPNQPGREANVDTQWTGVIAYPIPHIFYSTGGSLQIANGQPASNDAYLVWFNYLLGQEDIPPTISISYSNPETIFPLEYASSLCNLFAQLGLRGVSVIVSSGDDGVGRGDCRDNSGNVRFTPSFPSSCPWVTSVGGTVRQDPEVGMYMSGGGFSMHFTRPDYQEGMVAPFLGSLGSQYAGLYEWRHECVGARASFLPHLRQPASSINDITSGSNPGCGTDGFTAIPGWDPVTGMGTPSFISLQYLLDVLIPV